ncbi:MAG: hypothetical protein QW673_02525 [Candidatus Thermoplasmatota archaeon]
MSFADHGIAIFVIPTLNPTPPWAEHTSKKEFIKPSPVEEETINALKIRKPTHKNEITDASPSISIASSFNKKSSPNLYGKVLLAGKKALFNFHPIPLKSKIILTNFIPPAVEPAAPPTIIAMESKNFAFSDQLERFVVEKPVVVKAEIK